MVLYKAVASALLPNLAVTVLCNMTVEISITGNPFACCVLAGAPVTAAAGGASPAT
jgi:hypothetical protein